MAPVSMDSCQGLPSYWHNRSVRLMINQYHHECGHGGCRVIRAMLATCEARSIGLHKHKITFSVQAVLVQHLLIMNIDEAGSRRALCQLSESSCSLRPCPSTQATLRNEAFCTVK